MKNFYRKFIFASVLLWCLTAVFFVLYFVIDPVFIYFAVGSAIIGFIIFCVNELFAYKTINKKIDAGFDVYLQDYYRDGFITKKQLEDRAPELFPEFKKLYIKEKKVKIFFFMLSFACAVALVAYLIKIIF